MIPGLRVVYAGPEEDPEPPPPDGLELFLAHEAARIEVAMTQTTSTRDGVLNISPSLASTKAADASTIG
jgi:hypothetical protein